MLQEVSEAHPPGAVYFLGLGHVLELLLDGLVLLPVVRLLAKGASPDALVAPGVPEPDQLETVLGEVPHVDDGVVVVLEDALLALLCVLNAFAFLVVDAADKELLLVEVPKVGPCGIGISLLKLLLQQRYLLGHAACQIDQTLQDGTFGDSFVVLMQLHVGFLHELDPELLGVGAGAVQADSRIVLSLVGQECVDYNLRPGAVLKELEADETPVEVLFLHDEFLDYVGLCAGDGEGPDEPALAE